MAKCKTADYLITLRNNGTTAVNNIVLVDRVSGGVSPKNFTFVQLSGPSATIVCDHDGR